ncbi:DUF2726 domain-containing protein [Massilia sp. B-10]|nr:DUF2726 domain-containing protein [Massilia sp. B-10]UUZ52712.1 DUF2726 domain-containing protein [Massilia sp. H-1]
MAIAFVLATLTTLRKKKQPTLMKLGDLKNIKRHDPLTGREREMYIALATALPECSVLAQVAFSALITTTSQATRNRFDRKVADFVICTKQLAVIAVIELDDASHKTKAAADDDRDALLKNVGYKTIRYKNIPDLNTLRKDIATVTAREPDLAATN